MMFCCLEGVDVKVVHCITTTKRITEIVSFDFRQTFSLNSMQNNPFNNFLAQLQGAANNMPASSGQDSSGQSAANILGNANLLGAMQNALARGSTSMPGNVIGSLPGTMPSSSAAPDMSVFRQFQLQQNQPAASGANSQRTTSGSGGAGLLSGSPTASGNLQALSAWNNPTNPGAALNTLQVPSATWNNPATGASSNPAAGTASVGNFAGQSVNNNPLMNAMLQTYMSQQMAMQQAQTNPMAGLMQQMMQSMMPFNAVLPGAGSQVPALDPNMAKQLVMQLVGQLQQSGQLSGDDSIQQLLQPVAGGSNEATSNVGAPKVQQAESMLIDDDLEVKEESEQQPVVVKKTPRSTKSKGQELGSSTGADIAIQPKAPGKRNRQTKKSALATPTESAGQSAGGFGNIGGATLAVPLAVASSIKTEEGETPSSRRKGAAGKPGNKNIPEIVAIDSDSDDNSSSFQAIETASEGSSVVEEKKAKKGKGRGKAQEKVTKKPGKDQSVEPAVGIQRTKKADKSDQRTIPEPVRRIKIEDTAEDPAWIAEQGTRSPRVAKGVPSEPAAADLQVKAEESADVKPYIIPPGVKLRRCEVQLERLLLKRDAKGRFIVPEGSQKSSGAVMCKLEPAAAAGKSVSPYKIDMPNGGRRGSPGASRDISMTQSHGIDLLPNLNAASQPQMRTLYVGHMKGNMQWLNLIGWAKSRCFCQCAFCPILSETPKAILSHIRSEHPDLTFALTKMKQPSGKFLYIFCRHCDFIALDVTINWLHFEVYHNVSDILEGTARPRIDDFAPAKLEIQRGLEDIMECQQSYMCYDCELITDESKQLAIHVLQQHADTVHYNGCFVKLLGIRRPLKSENVPYKRIVSDEEFAEFRQEAFICMMCDYIAHCPYMALSHNLNTHQTKRILFSCMERDCTFNCVSESQMIQHLSGRHKLKADLTCSSTLLEPSHGSFVECVIGVNRKTSSEPSLQRCNVRAPVNPGRVSPVTFTSDEDTEGEDGAVNGEDNKEKTKKKIKKEGNEKNSLQCTAVSSSWEKGLENGDSETEEDANEGEDKLPDDIQITINPPSPDGVDGEAKSPRSDGSNDTIVEDAPNNDEVPPEQDEEPMAVEDASASKTGDHVESEQPPTLEPVTAKDLAAAGDDCTKDAGADCLKDAGAGDFAADIPPEPYCLSTDVRLQVPSADIGAFGTDVNAEGTSRDADEQPRQLNTPEKVFP